MNSLCDLSIQLCASVFPKPDPATANPRYSGVAAVPAKRPPSMVNSPPVM